jgi:hypothetical protein
MKNILTPKATCKHVGSFKSMVLKIRKPIKEYANMLEH